MQFRAKQIAAPKEWGTFEDLCHALFKRVWQDPLAQKNGRRGQAQSGVDIFGSPKGIRTAYLGVQCKGKDRNYGGQAEWSEILAEIQKAEKFSPPLEQWVFATTAPVDAHLQKAAREMSVKRLAEGLFSIEVLGWDEIQALMADHPEVIKDFYPEHSEYIPQVIESLRLLPSIDEKINRIIDNQNLKVRNLPNQHGAAAWDVVTFESNRGLGPALLGYALGPSDAAACPALNEVASVLCQLNVAYSARLVGEPGAGKSICSYQVAKQFVDKGFDVFRLLDPQSDDITLDLFSDDKNRLYLIDDAHLLKPNVLTRIEERSSPSCLVLSTHNAIDHVSHRGAITLDAKRAVKTIAASLRTNLPQTLEAVRLADDDVGERMMDTDIQDRLDLAESGSERPWQFCFVLGGGWRRSEQVADSARVAKTELILAAVAIRQMASRDARANSDEIAKVCESGGIQVDQVTRGLCWLEQQRLIISSTDCRTPHQRFASVVLKRILEGQDRAAREIIASMINETLCNPNYPIAGLRVLIHELRIGSANYSWTHLIKASVIDTAFIRCWAQDISECGVAAVTISELWNFVEAGAKLVSETHVATLANWISNPGDGANGLGHMLNILAQRDKITAEKVINTLDPVAIAAIYSNATPDTAYGIAELMRSIAYVRIEEFSENVRSAINKEKLYDLARNEAFIDNAFVFAKFCSSVDWLDKSLALEMAEIFIPSAREVLARDPVEGFSQLSHDLISTVLHAFDLLGIYVGKLKPTRRQLSIAKRLCDKIEPTLVAEQISAMRPRDFQSASFLLHFLCTLVPKKYEAVIRKIDWNQLDTIIGNDWADMPHEIESFLQTLYWRESTRDIVKHFISERAARIKTFSPLVLFMVPEIGISHINKGGQLRLSKHGHVDWSFGGIALAIVSEHNPELVEHAVHAFVDDIRKAITTYNRSYTGPAEGFIRTIAQHAPTAWNLILAKLDPVVAAKNFAECLKGDDDHRKTIATVIDSAMKLEGPVGAMAKQLRSDFPKTSIAPTGEPLFYEVKRRNIRKRKKHN